MRHPRGNDPTATAEFCGSWAGEAKAGAAIRAVATSPPAPVESAWTWERGIPSFTKRTEPSAKAKLAPPGCPLPKADTRCRFPAKIARVGERWRLPVNGYGGGGVSRRPSRPSPRLPSPSSQSSKAGRIRDQTWRSGGRIAGRGASCSPNKKVELVPSVMSAMRTRLLSKKTPSRDGGTSRETKPMVPALPP